MPKVNISPVIMEKIIVTNGPVNRTALKEMNHIQWITYQWKNRSITSYSLYPAKNINKNQLPGTANTNMASSVSVSPIMRNGMQARIKMFDTKNMALAGACACERILFYFSFIFIFLIARSHQLFWKCRQSLILNLIALLKDYVAQDAYQSAHLAAISSDTCEIHNITIVIVIVIGAIVAVIATLQIAFVRIFLVKFSIRCILGGRTQIHRNGEEE